MSSSSSPTSSPTSSTPFFTNSPSATSAPTSDNTENSSSLYLFTFLATLFLLLLISCGVILRSFILRRRLRRSVEDALAAGVILPSTFGARRSRRDFGEKPTFYDAWVTPGGEKWEYIMPISAQIKPNPLSGIYTPSADTPTRTLKPFVQWRRTRGTPSSTHSTAQTQTPSSPRTPSSMHATDTEDGSVQVSVLVAMPSSKSRFKTKSKSLSEDEEAETVPDVVVGVVHLPYRASAALSSSHIDERGD